VNGLVGILECTLHARGPAVLAAIVVLCVFLFRLFLEGVRQTHAIPHGVLRALMKWA
jgi:hypothetical protein